MKQIIVKQVSMENFKKFHAKTILFGDRVTSVYGQNYKGKSSIADAFSWVLFNKSSTGNTEGSQFRPRRYDESGNNIDHVDVVVELLLLVDGEELKIKKTQKQKWVRHKGDDFDSYMGDETLYEWNDVPVTPTDHKKKVEDIISEEVFRMITNPAAFPSLPAKKQREFLLKNVANITDGDVFDLYPEYAPVQAAMGKGSLDELLAKTKKEISEYKKKQEEIPVRIDQESKRVEDIDFSAKEAELAKLQEELADVESRLLDTGKAYEQLNELKVKRETLKGEITIIQSQMNNDYDMQKRNLQNMVDSANRDFSSIQSKQKTVEIELENFQRKLPIEEQKLIEFRAKFQEKIQEEIPEDSFVCPTCGQEMPEDRIEKIKADFASKKKSEIDRITAEGNTVNENIALFRQEIESCENQIEDLKNQKMRAMAQSNSASQDLAEFSSKPVDYESNPEYVNKVKELEAVEQQIAGIDTADADAMKEKIREERAAIQKSIDEVRESLALKKVIEQSKATIETLKTEMVQVTQCLAEREKLESLIEKFNAAKMNMLSEKINDKFKVVTWKLFEKQKNQRYAEVCVCQVNGSSYGENTTSATERMMAGMDIIRTLQEIYQVEAPIFLDDADLYNEWNIPAMDCQLIKLCVSDDEDLRVV